MSSATSLQQAALALITIIECMFERNALAHEIEDQLRGSLPCIKDALALSERTNHDGAVRGIATDNARGERENAGEAPPDQSSRDDKSRSRIAQGFNVLRVCLSLSLAAALLDDYFEQRPKKRNCPS